MVRNSCCEKMGLKKGPWTAEEDQILASFIKRNGHSNWRALPKLAGLLRCGKSCRLRWTNYLKPGIKRGNFNQEEQDIILHLHQKLGNRWSAIAAQLPGRTDNEIKNFWHTHLKKRAINKQSHVYKKNKAGFAMVEAKCKPPKNLNSSNQYQFPSSPTDMRYDHDERRNKNHIEIFEAFHQTGGGHWPEPPPPPPANFNGPRINSSAINGEEYVQSALRAMEFEAKMNDSMEFWFQLFVKAGGLLNEPLI